MHFINNLYFSKLDATNKIRSPMLLDMMLFDSVVSTIYFKILQGKTIPEDISKYFNIIN